MKNGLSSAIVAVACVFALAWGAVAGALPPWLVGSIAAVGALVGFVGTVTNDT